MTSAQLSPPTIFIGLGNPGEKYNGSRHNVGHHFLDLLAEKYKASAFKSESKLIGSLSKASFEGRKVLLFKSSKYINESGAKIKFDGGHGGHNGLRNIIHLCGSAFLRIRIGIGHPQTKDVINYVLSKPSTEELLGIEFALNTSVEAVGDMMNLGVAKAMDALHSNRA